MKCGVITFPGSNCDQDAVYVLKELYGMEVVNLWHKDHDLQGVDLVLVPGGFSYGDYLRSGAIARFSPVMQSVAQHAAKGGLVLGICNGFQILTEAGLLPGALLRNKEQRFICKNVHIRVNNKNTFATRAVEKEYLRIPISHAEGRYFADDDTLKSLQDNEQIIFTYCSGDGSPDPMHNPNGSAMGIAGICNEGRNVVGMMPHPERACDPALHNTDGRQIFDSIFSEVLEIGG